MGAASSITTKTTSRYKNNTYISYADEDTNAQILYDEILNSGFSAFQANFEKDVGVTIFQQLVQEIMEHSKVIIICISEKTVTSFRQAVEINIALNSNKNIVYIFTDEQFTPDNTTHLNGLVRYNLWLGAYNETTIIHAMETLESYDMLF